MFSLISTQFIDFDVQDFNYAREEEDIIFSDEIVPLIIDSHKYADASVGLYVSQPNSAIMTMSVTIPPNYATPLNIATVPRVVMDDTPLVDYFWSRTQLEKREEGLCGLVFQIEITRVDALDDDSVLRRVVVTSSVFIASFEFNFHRIFMNWIMELIDREGETEYDRLLIDAYSLHSVTKIILTRIVEKNGGGCKLPFERAPLPKSFVGDNLYCPDIGDNLCFYACVLYGVTDLHRRCLEARRQVTQQSGLVDEEEIRKFCSLFSVSVAVYSIEYFHSGPVKEAFKNAYVIGDAENHFKLLLKNHHYYLILNSSLLEYKKCSGCFKWIKKPEHFSSCQHCSVCKRKLSPNHNCSNRVKRVKRQHVQKNKHIKTDRFISDKNVWFADLETFMYGGKMIVYSSAIVSIDSLKDYEKQEVNTEEVLCEEFFGEGGFHSFCQYLLSLKGTVVFYNGSRFDLYFILKWLIEQRKPIKKFLRDDKSNRILSLQVGGVRFWDLCLFTMGSLSAACRDLKVPEIYCKKDFDHSRIVDWTSVYKLRDEIVYYNKYDVISLGIAYFNFATTIFKLYKFNCIEAISLSNMAYEIWRTHYVDAKFIHKITLPNDDEYDFMRRGLFGGRCCPQRKLFISQEYDRYSRGEIGSKDISDYLVYLDVVSLYPYSCMIGVFPCGDSKFITSTSDFYLYMNYLNYSKPRGNICQQTEEKIKRSFFEVDIFCPTDILTPFLFEKGPKGELIQNLNPKTCQVYDGTTLLEASRLGYRVSRVYRILQYASSGNTLDGYMSHAFEQKNNSAKGSIDYACHKYLMNGLTGKFNQIKRDLDWKVIYDDSEISTMLTSDVKKFEWLLNEDSEIRAALVGVHSQKNASKPLQYGVNILSMSRVLMSMYTDFIGGYGSEEAASYYGDTDSMIIHNNAYRDALGRDTAKRVFGDEFGRLSEEWKGGKIIRAIFLAPKTYLLEILKAEGKLVWHMAAKGIPQSFRDVDVADYYTHHNRDVDDTVTDLKTIVYSLIDYDGESVVSSRRMLNWEYFEAMTRGLTVVCSFGTMKRRIADATRGNIVSSVELLLDQQRTINQVDWWASGKRSNTLFEMSYPQGHLNY